MPARVSAHEAPVAHDVAPRLTERRFGIVAAVALTVAGAAIPLLRGREVHPWLLGIAAAAIVLALLAPVALKLPSALFARFTRVVHAVVSNAALGLVFFGTITPIALVMRLFRRDTLRRRRHPEAASYWLPREPNSSSMKNQY